MLRAITILLLTLVASRAADAGPPQQFRLRATVLDVALIEQPTSGGLPRAYMLVDFDPRFALTMRVVSISPSLAHFSRGRTVTFAIHSPAILFAASDPKNKTYDFILRPPKSSEKVALWSLQFRRQGT
jgi:hypothetical protein